MPRKGNRTFVFNALDSARPAAQLLSDDSMENIPDLRDHEGVNAFPAAMLLGLRRSKMPSACQMNPEYPTINCWYAIRVRYKFEQAVSVALAGKGYEEYLPLYHSRRNWSDRSKSLDLPLFPGYLFCRLDVRVRLPILTTPGVISILGTGKTPVAVPDREIDAVRTLVRSGLHLLPWPQLVVGSRVLIEKGPLKGVEGVTLDIKKKHRLCVSVPLLQRSVAVEIDREWVRPLSPSKAPRMVASAPRPARRVAGGRRAAIETGAAA